MIEEFKFSYIDRFLARAKSLGYGFYSLKDFFLGDLPPKSIVLRVDVDFDPIRVMQLMEIYDKYNAKASFFFRFHGKYNSLSFPVIDIIQNLLKGGHELGIHTELVDLEKICKFDPVKSLRMLIDFLQSFFNTKIYGTASHGDHTGFNNLDFWNDHTPADFGLLYEAYDKRLFNKGIYCSDSLISKWKFYDKGQLSSSEKCDPINVIEQFNDQFIYLLMHPDSFYNNHYHENIRY